MKYSARNIALVTGLLFLAVAWTTGTAHRLTTAETSETGLFNSSQVAADSVERITSRSAGNIVATLNETNSYNLVAGRPTRAPSSAFEVVAYPYFTPVFRGNGIDHMNINLVNLSQTGLLNGDEIGVFDGVYCVGAAVISKDNITENFVSIAASANDTVESQPNGFIEGHPISLKLYRDGTVYLLYFNTVNNTANIFVRNGSMFALVDFSQSVGQPDQGKEQSVRLYPNPFDNHLLIQITLPKLTFMSVKIFDQKGILIRTLCETEKLGQLTLNWDGRDNRGNLVPAGTYFCKINGNTTKIIYKGTNSK